jgi:hypothetical protein
MPELFDVSVCRKIKKVVNILATSDENLFVLEFICAGIFNKSSASFESGNLTRGCHFLFQSSNE